MRLSPITVFLVTASVCAHGQEPASPGTLQSATTPTQAGQAPAFDAVSVKPLGPAGMGTTAFSPLRVTPGRASGVEQLPNLISRAYSVKLDRIVLPEGAAFRVNLYRIDAVMPSETTAEELNLMLRTMLIERFGLQFHRELRDTPVYLMNVGDKFKLKPVDPDKVKDQVFDTPLGPKKGCSSYGGTGRYTSHCASMGGFASAMGQRLDRLVFDQTGLPGIYDINLQWDPNDPLDLISAIQRELGLKIDRGRAPIERLIVDRLSVTPSPN